ncbi:MAG TPA: hypothetical protein VFF73_13300 [Planctomycetota bacterium]|nr:hypothetical protein [Planctomycetota bacterium]
MRLELLLAPFVVLVLAAPAGAQDPVPVSLDDLAANGSWGANRDKPVSLSNVKFRDYFEPNVRLVVGPRDKLRVDSSARRKLADALATWKTPAGEQLDRKGRSNVKVIGVAREDNQVGRYIDVTDVSKLPDDLDAFTARRDALAATDADGRLKLADEAVKRADLYSTLNQDDLREFARQLFDGALDLKKATLQKGDAAAAIDVALKYRDLAGAPNKAIGLLGDIVESGVEQDARDKLVKVLEQDLGAVRHRDHWISKEDFKSQLGYMKRVNAATGAVQWVRKERVEFEAVVANRREVNKTDPIVRQLLGSQYETAANEGQPTLGMYKQELVRTKGYGFPQLVDRFVDKSAGNPDRVWEQWVMSDGNRFYFMDGVMFDWKKKADPYPTK